MCYSCRNKDPGGSDLGKLLRCAASGPFAREVVCLTVRCMPAEGVGAVRDVPAAGTFVGARTRESSPTGELGCQLPTLPRWERLPM
jgi:hypothetical protein